MAKRVDITLTFFTYLRTFYEDNRGKIRNRYKDLTKKFLDFNDKSINDNAFLRRPQFEALEMYVFLKEFMNNRQIYDIFEDWYKRRGDFSEESWYMYNTEEAFGQMSLFDVKADDEYKTIFDYMKNNSTSYANYIFALTMGLGKTILMATCIFYEFLLAYKYPKDDRYCHNVLVFAPDKTVLEALREIITFDKSKVVPKEYISLLDANLKFHFLDDTGITLNTLDGSDFNIIISNTQKIIRKFVHKEKTSFEKLMDQPSLFNTLYSDLPEMVGEDELKTNQRYEKLTRLEQLGVYVDEAHHMFGKDLEKSITSLRQTINDLNVALESNNTKLVACYNFTGTPYVENSILPEVVYYYGLKEAIAHNYLKTARVVKYENVKDKEFIKTSIVDFWKNHGNKLYEGLPAKLAIFGATVDEVQYVIKPIVEEVIAELGLPFNKILVNVGDETITKDTDIKYFNNLDVVGTEGSQKQFILLCGKGREGWNCRSLFGVALFRSPKSKIFVLQATMRCLRKITDIQQEATVYLSEENFKILNDELQKNFRVTIDDIHHSSKIKKEVEVHLVKNKSIRVDMIERHYTQIEKQYNSPINFELDSIDCEKYKSYVNERMGLDENSLEIRSELDNRDSQVDFSKYMIVGEIARFLRIDCSLIERILNESKDGIEKIVSYVSKYNDILYDVIIPKIFNTLNEIKCNIINSKKDVPLLKLPEDRDFYKFMADPNLVVSLEDNQFIKVKDKSFHTDNYCFDSIPEKQCFMQYIFNEKVKEIYFTGMFTSQNNGLGIQYIDPETKVIHTYYPDFIAFFEDGTVEIIEVKGDNKIDDVVVKAKAEAAEEMASINKMRYKMIKGSDIINGKDVVNM